jgi:hypothetical protein
MMSVYRTDKMTNVLLVSYLFPPSGGVGVPRAISYTRYLPFHGCRVFVVTARNAATPLYDPELLSLVPPETRVSRVFNPELSYSFRDRIWRMLEPPHRHKGAKTALGQGSSSPFRAVRSAAKSFVRSVIERMTFPDVQNAWIPFATRKACQIIEYNKIDAVILNIPPYSTFKVVVALRRRYPNLKLLIDLRDDWLGYYLIQFDTPSDYKLRRAQALERAAMESASFVSTVTPALVEALRKRYPDQPREKFFYAPNGYEPDSFRDLDSRPHNQGKVVITYFGTVYMSHVYSPQNYLDAIDELPEQVRANIETRFIGRVTAESQPCLSDRRSAVKQLGFLPKLEGIRRLGETDYLLLIVNDPTAHAGKLFDYLASGKPILALSPPDGEIAHILERTRTGWCADAGDKLAIKSMLLAAYQRVKLGSAIVDPDWVAIREYSWPEIVHKVVNTIGIAAVQERDI